MAFDRSLLQGLASTSFEDVAKTTIDISTRLGSIQEFDLLLETFVRMSSVITRGDLLPPEPCLHALAFGVLVKLIKESRGNEPSVIFSQCL